MHYAVLHSFTGPDGALPLAGLALDSAGNLYGTTGLGGASNLGVVFKLDPSGNETVLHSFNGSDGSQPDAGVLLDESGDLYGTAQDGGASGLGVVFKLDATGNESVLHSFNGSDGAFPESDVIRDSAGNLYGTTYVGGSTYNGVVYKLDPGGHETVLHSFFVADGALPSAGLVRDPAGYLYGVAALGGDPACQRGCGTVFKIGPNRQETVLLRFNRSAGGGRLPFATLIRDSAGNLYGTTFFGGGSDQGVVFKLDTSGDETVLHRFSGADGRYPYFARLLRDDAGNLYGTTFRGGLANQGVAFKIDANGNETVLHNFGPISGGQPSDLVRDAAGNLYGTAKVGGSSNEGVVFKLSL